MAEPEHTQAMRGHAFCVRQFEVTVVAGADRGLTATSNGSELSIGTSEGNGLRLADPAVSRHHCALRTSERGLEVRDLGSRNGTHVGDCEVVRAFVRGGARITIGETTVAVRVLDSEIEQPLAQSDRLVGLLGGSPAMRRMYPLIEHCAHNASTVLVRGETGTGKELVAEAIHELGPRRRAPFVVIDCGALSAELAESELFGHERGAFTGADAARAGAFEQADGGTVFLDEIGELPLALQPLLLRVLEARTIRRVGASADMRAVDVRVIAASHRDLRALVNDKRFRADLYYRLDVMRVEVPPLRERAGDVAMLAAQFWRELRPDRAVPEPLLARLAAQAWPGNVRELRNAVERAALIGWAHEAAPPAAQVDVAYQAARDRVVWEWEAGWVARLVAAHGGNLSRAARAATMGRSYLRELCRKHGVAAGAGAASGDDDDTGQ
jgi:transcriptional regulator with GAF, ATPase, and Fis domain|nr:sigma 54-interacting transcriptional regulator [Kofleriaceae bacterium]